MSIEDQNAGEAIRREVMGTTHVDTPLGSAKNFDMPEQEWAMEHLWTCDGLDRKTRSVVSLSMLIALNADGERPMASL